MKFDLDKILSMLKNKKKRKSSAEEDFKNKEDITEVESNEEFEDDLFEDEEMENEEIENEEEHQEKDKKTSKKKFSIDLKNRKVQLSIAAIAVLALGAVSAPYIMSYIGEQQANSIGNVSNIMQPIQMPKPKPRPVVKHLPNGNIYKNKPIRNIKEKENQNRITYKTEQKKYIHNMNHNIHNVENTVAKTQNNIIKNNFVQHANKAVSISIDKGSTNKISQIEQAIKGTDNKIREIQEHLVNAKLRGVNDPIGMIDETVMKNRNFDLYLQSQIQLMRKLISYYKQKAELQKTLQLYKMAFYGNTSEISSNKYRNNQKKTEELQQTLQKVVEPLQQQIATLKQELVKVTQQRKKQDKGINVQRQNIDFNQMTKTKLNDLNIFVKNGKYIAVVHTDMGDRIFKEGNYFNGYKIEKILPNMIIFEKDGQKFYYSYNQTLNQKYSVAKIALPGKLSKSEVKTQRRNKTQVKEYKTVSRQELLQELLQKRLKQMR